MNQVARMIICFVLSCVCTSGFAHDRKAIICHQTDSEPHIIEVSVAALAAHTAHGDYIAQFVVEPQDGAVGDGIHFARISDALAAARAVRIARGELREAACRITILVAPGIFRGSFNPSADSTLEEFPLFVDVPQITLRGGLRMVADADNRATGASEDEATVTTLAPDRPLADAPLYEGIVVVVGHPNGSRADGTVIEGFAFQSGHVAVDNLTGGAGVLAQRVVDLVVRGNRFEPALTTAVALRATSARIERNQARRLGFNCSFCLSGPGDYEVADNRLVEGGLGGIYLAAIGDFAFSLGAHPVAPVEPYVFPATAAMRAIVVNNDIRGHVRQPIGFAVRMPAVGLGALNVPQSMQIALRDNDFVHNTFALIVDAGFPAANSPVGAEVDVSLDGNGFAASCQNDLLVAFTRHTSALGLPPNPINVHNSTYRVELGGDLNWSDAWYSQTAGFGNTLVVNGVVVPPGSHVAYDPTRPCSL
jgi:hypothetical protein